MLIDAHQHFWIYSPQDYSWIDDSMAALQRDFLPSDLSPELEVQGFHGTIAVQARQTLEETRWLLELADKSSSVLGVVGWVDLQSKDVGAELERFAQNPKLVGIRHIVQSEPDDRFLLRPDFLRGVSRLQEFGLAYDILIYPKHLPVATEFVEKFPLQKFVLDHLAKPRIKLGDINEWEKGIRRLAAFPNVFGKLSGLVTEADWQKWTPDQITPYLDVVLESFGPDRLMIGSDWPVCLVAGSYSKVLRLVWEYVVRKAPSSLGAILGGNAHSFYRLDRS